ncbi:MAG: condensation domain-containing protein [Candidatus Eisenbacteria bacterium]
MLRGLPNARLSGEIAACRDLLDRPHDDSGRAEHPEDWLARADGRVAIATLSASDWGAFDLALLRDAGEARALAYPVPRTGGARTNAPLKLTMNAELQPRLRAALNETLPEWMVPSHFIVLDQLPLTPNGKLDRSALPSPSGPTRAARDRTPPESTTELAVAAVWRELLRVDELSVDDDFFELGGHSLLATQAIARIRAALSVEPPLRVIFEHSTLRALSRWIDEAATPARATAPPGAIPSAPRDHDLPLSLAQERIWFIDRLEPGTPAYNVPNALRLEGRLDQTALARALDQIVLRHVTLRTRFHEGAEGPLQSIEPVANFHLEPEEVAGENLEARIAEARRRVAAEAIHPFDLTRGRLLRARLLRLGSDDHVLVLVAHHIATDGWSMGVLVRELSALYRDLREGREPLLPSLPLSYLDWALWQRRELNDREIERQLDYWRGTLRGVEPLALPADLARPAHPSGRGDSLELNLDPSVVARARQLARSEGATLHMLLLAAYAALLRRVAGQGDIAIATPVAGRPRAELEELVGFFVNTLPLRLNLRGNALSFRQLLARVKESALSAYAHQDVPFEQMVAAVEPERDTSRNPIFQTLFALHNLPFGELELPGLSLRSFEFTPMTAQFEVEISLFEIEGNVAGRLHWSTDLFRRDTMERLAASFTRLLDAFTQEPDHALDDVPLLTAEEASWALRMGEGEARAIEPMERSLVELFQASVARDPSATALELGGVALSYGELDHRSTQLAAALRARGLGAERRAALLLARGFDLVIALWRCGKTGAAYVPLDPDYPAEAPRLDAGNMPISSL